MHISMWLTYILINNLYTQLLSYKHIPQKYKYIVTSLHTHTHTSYSINSYKYIFIYWVLRLYSLWISIGLSIYIITYMYTYIYTYMNRYVLIRFIYTNVFYCYKFYFSVASPVNFFFFLISEINNNRSRLRSPIGERLCPLTGIKPARLFPVRETTSLTEMCCYQFGHGSHVDRARSELSI